MAGLPAGVMGTPTGIGYFRKFPGLFEDIRLFGVLAGPPAAARTVVFTSIWQTGVARTVVLPSIWAADVARTVVFTSIWAADVARTFVFTSMWEQFYKHFGTIGHHFGALGKHSIFDK